MTESETESCCGGSNTTEQEGGGALLALPESLDAAAVDAAATTCSARLVQAVGSMGRIRCANCGAIYDRPEGMLSQINGRYHCTRCSARLFVPLQQAQPPGSAALVVGAAAGAALGAAVGGPPGTVVGGIIGLLIGAKNQ
jgi:DNA-directed RNA polymerase subunit RPC12/RpoP